MSEDQLVATARMTVTLASALACQPIVVPHHEMGSVIGKICRRCRRGVVQADPSRDRIRGATHIKAACSHCLIIYSIGDPAERSTCEVGT